MKEKILKYREINPKAGYFDLIKIFGLGIDDIMKTLDITDYKINYFSYLYKEIDDVSSLIIYDDDGNIDYFESPSKSYWTKYKYDERGNNIYEITNDGFWIKYEYNNKNSLKYSFTSDGDKYRYVTKSDGSVSQKIPL